MAICPKGVNRVLEVGSIFGMTWRSIPTKPTGDGFAKNTQKNTGKDIGCWGAKIYQGQQESLEGEFSVEGQEQEVVFSLLKAFVMEFERGLIERATRIIVPVILSHKGIASDAFPTIACAERSNEE